LADERRQHRGTVFAGNAAWRKEVIPKPKPEPAAVEAERRSKRLTRTLRGKKEGERPSWSDLLARVFGEDGYRCPGCGGRLVLRSMVVNPPATTKILRGLEKAQGPP
jgi:hypothetical protein